MQGNPDSLLLIATEIRDLLRLLAEPAIALRDEKHRAGVRQLVGKSPLKRKAVLLMDGSQTQIEIKRATGVDQGDLSKLVKALREVGLLDQGDKPKLLITLPSNFFDEGGN
jgi:DNA-binding MarR family transcriptional regulator